jgi:hypothetical protein
MPDQTVLVPDAKTVKDDPHRYLPYHFYLYQMLEEARTHAQTAAGPKPKLFRILPQLKMKARCITLGDTALAGLVQRMAEQSTTSQSTVAVEANSSRARNRRAVSTPADRATVVLLGHVEHQRNQGVLALQEEDDGSWSPTAKEEEAQAASRR